MNPELVSIIIPTRNRERLIQATLQSVLAQTHRPLEVVVVDDGSTDNTEAVVHRLIGSADGVRLVYLKTQHGGCSRARNLGLEAATGNFVQHLDSDDLLLPRKIHAQLEYLRMHREVDAVYSFSQTIDGSIPGRVIGWKAYQPRDLYAFCLRPWVSILDPLVVLWRRDVFARVGKYDAQLCRWVDWDFSVRFFSGGGKIGCLPEYLAAYRVHEDRVTNRAHGERGIHDVESVTRALTKAWEGITAAGDARLGHALSERAWSALEMAHRVGAQAQLEMIVNLLREMRRRGWLSPFARFTLSGGGVNWWRYRLLARLYDFRIHAGRWSAKVDAPRE